MTLSYQHLTPGTPEYEKTKQLYYIEFPDKTVEPEFEYLVDAMNKMGADIFAYTDNGDYAGYSITIPGKTHVYYYMIAVSPELRSRGIGGQIASLVKGMYPGKSLTGLVEADDLSPEGLRTQERRLAFHGRNGLKNTGYHLLVEKREYIIISTAENFNPKDMSDIKDKFLINAKEMSNAVSIIPADK